MKTLGILILVSVLLFSCNCGCNKSKKEFGYDLEVTYLDGTLDTFDVKHIDVDTVYPALHEGCLTLYATRSSNKTIACGVRKFEVLGYYSEKIKEKK